ncbi:MAG: LacI family DNA-binding transcriptional regulator [Anaerolineae bacterium]
MKTKRPTVRDVAREAGVSYQTVSRVINNDPHVAPETRDRVSEAIVRIGFRPNRAAQVFQTERSHTLEAVIFYGGFNRFLFEMAHTAHVRGYHFSISAISEDEFYRSLESASSRFVDGLLLIPKEALEVSFDELHRLTDGIPVVQIGAPLGANVPSVIYAQALGARMAAQHLIDLGHRQIAEISGPLMNYDAHDRHSGWFDTLRENGLTPGKSTAGDYSLESGYRAMIQLLDSGEPFTAVFVANDSMALGASTALRERGYRVPDDISLVGFDDIPEAEHFVPSLTTVRQDFNLMGKVAVDYLVRLIEQPDTPVQQTVLHPRLIVRSSTAPPRTSSI